MLIVNYVTPRQTQRQFRESLRLGHSLGFMCVCASDCVCACVCVVCMCVSMCRACSISPSDGEVVPSTTGTAPTRTMVILLWATDTPNTHAQGHAISKQQDNT